MKEEGNAVSLKPGDTLGICAPSGCYDQEMFLQGIQVLEEMGFRIYLPPGLDKREGYLAGGDDHRAGILNALIHDPAVHGIMCARGGYGAMRILSHIDYPGLKKFPKPLVGFSDITALLAAVGRACGIQVIHGPVITSLGKNDGATRRSLFKALTGIWEDIRPPLGRSLAPGQARGALAGGNLATLVHLMGTPYQPDFGGTVLFLEDINEPLYKIDRMVKQMDMADLFKGVRGVVLGTFQGCGDIEQVEALFMEIFQGKNFPVMAGLESGHGAANICLPLGRMVTLDADVPCLILGKDGGS